MASPCTIEQLLQLRSGYEAAKTIRLSVLWLCVQKTSEKIIDLVCCQDLCAKKEHSVQLLVAVKVFGGSLRKFSPERIFGSPACFEEIWPFADQDWREDALLLVGKVLFLNTRFKATGRAATTAQGAHKLKVRWWHPFVHGWPSTSRARASFLRASGYFVALVFFLTMFSGSLSSETLSATHK